jgi:hypothetical protein
LFVFATFDLITPELKEMLQMAVSGASLLVTAYFWFIRANRERVSVGIFPVSGFEGALNGPGLGVWTGQVFLTNRSILATAILSGKAELYWEGRWITGNLVAGDGFELPWNLPPAQAYSKTIIVAFDVGVRTTAEKVYESQRIRVTFLTVEGQRVAREFRTNAVHELAAAA